MTTVEIPLDSISARIYQKASAEKKKKLQILMSLWLREFDQPSKSLDEIMDEMSRKAKDRGLTPEVFQSILNGK
jgi:predicted metalloprotease with PDZ domain